MRIGPDEVRRIADLAEIGVDDSELPDLVRQLDRIVDYVAQIESHTGDEDVPPFIPGPAQAALREDEVRPTPLDPPPESMAPEWRDGYFVVPRLRAMDAE